MIEKSDLRQAQVTLSQNRTGEIRNTKSETLFNFQNSNFEFVSCFVFRASILSYGGISNV